VRDSESKEAELLLSGCLKGDREAQRKLYKLFFGYAMSICLRYSKDAEEAREVLNDGFLKVFTKLDHYDPQRSLKGWIRRIMINTALDNYRHNLKHYYLLDIKTAEPAAEPFDVLQQINYDYLVRLVQKLSPAYRTVFSLHVIDGHTHEEIAEMLGISIGTSKSNLSKARAHLKEAIEKSRINETKQYI
jgi:RNA polymerase sigma factor (sigma-70 family)